MQPTILTYNLGAKQFQMELLCANFHVIIRNIRTEEQSFTINSLLETNTTRPQSNTDIFSDEMIVFCNFSNIFLEHFLQQLRNLNIRISLKAILTPTNKKWSSVELYKELVKEYNALNTKK